MKNKALAVFATLALGMGISFAGNSTPQSASERPSGGEVLTALNTEAALRTESLAAQAARPYKAGFVREGEEIVCAAAGKTAAGACWTVRLDQKTAQPLRISARGKIEAVDGQGEALLYVDVSYQDGDHLWGVKERFTPKPGDWTKRHVLLVPAKPIRVMAIYVMARGSTTLRARFCPPALERFDLKAVNATLFDNVPVAKRVTLDKPCLLVRDVQAGSGFEQVAGTAKGARFETRCEAAGGATFYDVSVEDVQGGDHALTFVWAQPLAAGRLEYFASPRAAQDVTDAKGDFRDLVPVPCGAGGHSRWPFLAAAVDGKGVAIGLDPRRPGFSRVSLHAGLRLLYAAFDVALVPEKKSARVGFVVFPFEAKDGFRGALEAYQRLFPEFNEVKQTKQGNWMAFRPISKVEGWEDFGFAIKEGDHETDWDDAHGITTYHYTEPTTWWMGIKGRDGREQATMAECVAEAERLAAEGKQRYARAWKVCAFRDENGDPCGVIRNTPWCNGIAWNLNCAPGQGPDGEFEAKLGEAHFAKNYRGVFPEGLDGEYVDSSEMYVTAPIDFNRANFAGMDTPLVFGAQNLKPGVFKGMMGYEYVREAWRKVRARGRRMMANGTPGRWWWLAPYLDVMGTETNWLRDGKWQPSPDSVLIYARAMCGAKPYCFLMNTDFNAFTSEWVDKYMQRALAYGMYPSFFSPQATSKSHYFMTPAYYNRDRALFKKYMPLCIRVGEAGWRPVNRLLASDAPQVITEQFGDRYATIYNLATNTMQVTLTSLSGATTARELVGGGEWRFANGRHEVQVPGETVFVLDFQSP